MKTLALVALIIVVVACGSSGRDVTRQQYGEGWPFTVERGVVDCDARGHAIFKTRSPDVTGTWALTGAARAAGYHAIDPFWRDDHNIPGAKVPLAQMINLARAEC